MTKLNLSDDEIRQYQKLLWKWTWEGDERGDCRPLKGRTHQELEDVISKVWTAFITNVNKGNFKGKHGKASIISFLKKAYIGARADLFRELNKEPEFVNCDAITRTVKTVDWKRRKIMEGWELVPEQRIKAGESAAHVGFSIMFANGEDAYKDNALENMDRPPATAYYGNGGDAEKYINSQFNISRNPLDRLRDIELEKIIRASRHRDILYLFYVEGFTRKEIAKEMNLTEGQVKRRLEDGRKQIVEKAIKLGYQVNGNSSENMNKSKVKKYE